MKKIVFILNCIGAPHSIKRIKEFVENGYEVESYGFLRKLELFNSIETKTIGKLAEEKNYLARLFIIPISLLRVFAKYRNEDVVYYYFDLNIALFAAVLSKKKYIYEESDMTHLNLNNKIIGKILEIINKQIIKKSLETVFTSGGFLKFHCGNNIPNNVSVVPNKLSGKAKEYYIIHKPLGLSKFGFVGSIRYMSIYKFAKIIGDNFKNRQFHFFGDFSSREYEKIFYGLKEYENIFFHGKFLSPDDLPSIYSEFNLLLSMYDVDKENVRWAEPNKLYEAIYFETPIIASRNTYLADKINKLGIGYSFDINEPGEIVDYINNLTLENLMEKIENCKKIPKDECIGCNAAFLSKITQKLL
jgi:glycosyltransferase involved in cell wall biosynthesis